MALLGPLCQKLILCLLYIPTFWSIFEALEFGQSYYNYSYNNKEWKPLCTTFTLAKPMLCWFLGWSFWGKRNCVRKSCNRRKYVVQAKRIYRSCPVTSLVFFWKKSWFFSYNFHLRKVRKYLNFSKLIGRNWFSFYNECLWSFCSIYYQSIEWINTF